MTEQVKQTTGANEGYERPSVVVLAQAICMAGCANANDNVEEIPAAEPSPGYLAVVGRITRAVAWDRLARDQKREARNARHYVNQT